MSDTPRTDSALKWSRDVSLMVKHASQLERELNAANEAASYWQREARRLDNSLAAANERIAELQSELDGFKAWNWKLREVGEDMDYRLTLHASHEPILKTWKEIRNGLNQ